MREVCYCGRNGDVEDREPIRDGSGEQALMCPECGSVDYLHWLPEMSRRLALEEAERRQLVGSRQPGHGREERRTA